MKAYEVELDYYKQMKTFMLDVGEGILNTARDVNGQLKTQEQFIKDYMDYMENVKGYAKEDIIPSLAAITKEFGTQSVKMDEMAESIKKTEEKMAGLQKEIDLAEVGMSKFAKTLYRIPILGKAVQLAITGIKVALASIGIGLLIQGLS